MAPSTCVHQVSYFDASDRLAATITSFFAAPLLRGEAVVVVATPEHRTSLAERLAASGVDLHRARVDGRYVERDAAQTLAALSDADGTVSREQFQVQVADMLIGLDEQFGAVSAYGEMVGLLSSRGHLVAALELERLWVELLEELPLRLLCGYPGESVPSDERHHVDALHDGEAPVVSETAAVGLPLDASAGPLARQAVLDTCAGWGLAEPEWADDVALVASELVGNAIRHGGPGIVMQLDRDGDALRLGVSDGSPEAPRPREVGEFAEDGRGLMIVEALAEGWGVEAWPNGKVVWARLRSCPGPA